MIMRDRRYLPLMVLTIAVCGIGFALGAGLLRWSFSHQNVASADTAAPVLVSALTDKDFEVTGGLTISGHLSAPDGSPLAGVPVEAEPVTPGAQVAPAAFVTDEKGNYSVALLSPGFFKVHFAGGRAAGGVWAGEWYQDGQPGGAQAVPAGASGVDAVLQPTGVLNVRLDFPDNNNPFPVRVVAFANSEPTSAGESGAGPIGLDPSFVSFAALPASDYKLMVIPDAPAGAGGSPGYAPFWYAGGSDWRSAGAVSISAGKTTEIEISLAQAKGTGGVFGEISYDRDAYDSAALTLVSEADSQKEVAPASVSHPRSVSTHGRFAIPDVPAGDYKMRCALPDGRVVWYQEGSIGGTADFAEASTISITPERMVQKLFFDAMSLPSGASGQIVRADGTPVAYRPVFAERLSGGEAKAVYSFGAWTDNEGRFSGPLSPGRYRLCTIDWASLKEYCGVEVELGTGNRADTAIITMPRETPSHATITGRAKAADGTAAKLVEVVLEPAGGGSPQVCVADMQGVYRFDVSAGSYRIRTANGPATENVRVKDGEVLTDVDVRSID